MFRVLRGAMDDAVATAAWPEEGVSRSVGDFAQQRRRSGRAAWSSADHRAGEIPIKEVVYNSGALDFVELGRTVGGRPTLIRRRCS